MAIAQKLINLNAYFRSTPGTKIIINDLNILSLENRNKISESILTVYDNTDVLSTKPSCECGATQGRYLLGRVCRECGTECKEPHSKLYPLLWLKSLRDDLPFVNPSFWCMLSSVMSSTTDYLRWLSDDKYNPRVKIPPYILTLKELLGGIRSYKNTIEHFERIIVFLLSIPKFKAPHKQRELKELLNLYKEHKEDIFSEYLPIVNKKLFVMENTNKGKFINLAASDAIEVVMGWLNVVSLHKDNLKKEEVMTCRAISNLSGLFHTYLKQYITSKYGWIRKHNIATRCYFSCRCVITSRPGSHKNDEIEMPWVIGPTVFRPHILNKLINQRHYAYQDAVRLLNRSIKKYEPVIDEILQELIDESPEGKIPVTIQRNPSIKRGSAIRVFITKFKSDDIRDKTISLSQLVVKLGNGDYDGDEENVMVMLDEVMANEARHLAPHFSTMNVDKPYQISKFITVLSQSDTTIGNMLSSKRDLPGTDTIVNRLSFVNA